MYTLVHMDSIPAAGEIWQHYKTKGEYEIVGVGRLQVKHEGLDMQECVVYRALNDGNLWVRPLEDFIERVRTEGGETVQRFIKIA